MGVIFKTMALDEPFLPRAASCLESLASWIFMASTSESLQAYNCGKLSCKYTDMT